MQNVNTMIRRPVPFGATVAAGLVAFAAGAVIAIGAPVAIAGLSTGDRVNASVSASANGAEQTAHTRTERSLARSTSFGPEQTAHTRTERGLASQ